MGHEHYTAAARNKRCLLVVLALTGSNLMAELVGGFLTVQRPLVTIIIGGLVRDGVASAEGAT